MVQGIMELLFDAAYLITAMTIGILLVRKGGTRFFRMFGIMAIVLASGDAFHLVPRVIALLTTGLEANAFRLGLGKLITSITMTGFYLILYFILEEEYRPDSKQKAVFRISLIALAAIRVILCACPQNNSPRFSRHYADGTGYDRRQKRCFEGGADDYLTKPVDFDELALRINALFRRYRISALQSICHRDFVLDY